MKWNKKRNYFNLGRTGSGRTGPHIRAFVSSLTSFSLPIWMETMLDGAIRRAVIIGNGFAGAENQSIGLIRALGLSNHHSLYVTVFLFLIPFPFSFNSILFSANADGFWFWFCFSAWRGPVEESIDGFSGYRFLSTENWTPFSEDCVVNRIMFLRFPLTTLVMLARCFYFNHIDVVMWWLFECLLFCSGISNVLEADAHHIATMARETFHKYVCCDCFCGSEWWLIELCMSTITLCFYPYRDGPLLVVASGRDTISVASSIKRLASDNVFLVQVKLFTLFFLMFWSPWSI